MMDFTVLWKSRLVPQDPFTYRGSLCEDLKAKIRDTFLNLHNEPDAKKFLENLSSVKFVPMKSEDYDLIRDLRAAQEKQKQKG